MFSLLYCAPYVLQYVFMDMDTYEETRLEKDEWAKYLTEGAICSLLFYNGKVISVEPPQFVELKVVECPPNVKGNTAAGEVLWVADLLTECDTVMHGFCRGLPAGLRVAHMKVAHVRYFGWQT
eukprot:jgi/Chrzof1/3798/Cz13g09070.t1